MPKETARTSGLSALAARVGRRKPEPEPEPPAGPPAVVSVVVPVYEAREYLDECLDSLRSQSYPHLQIVVIDDGSTDGSAEICARHAADDARIRVHRQQNAGLGAARNAGIARVTGRYLTFLDADDTLPVGAYQAMVETLERTGSDFAVGAVQRVTHGVRRTPAWIGEVHQRARDAISIDDFPRAVFDVIACNRMLRTSFWRGAGLRFPEGVAYEDHLPMMAAYVRARAFDLLVDTTYYWRIREDQTSIGQQKHVLGNLQDRLLAKRQAGELLGREASPLVREAWCTRVLDMDLQLFIERVPEVDDEYFAILREGVQEHLAAATPAVIEQVRAERRIKALLVADGRRRDLETLLAAEQEHGPVGATEVDGDALVACYPDLPDLPTPVRRLTDRQTALRVTLRRCWWSSPGTLELDLSAYIPYLDLAGLEPTARAWWVDDAGATTSAALSAYSDPEITRSAQPTWQSYDRSGLRLTTDVGALLGGSDPAAGAARQWHLELEVAAGGLVRRGVVRHRDGLGSAAALRPSGLPGGVRIELDHERDRGLLLVARGSVAIFEQASLVDGDLVVSARAAGADPLQRLTVVTADGVRAHVVLPGSSRTGQGRWSLEQLRTPTAGDRWQLRAMTEAGKTLLAWPPDVPEDWLDVAGTSSLLVRRTSGSGVTVAAAVPDVEVLDVEVAVDRFVVTARWLGPEAAAEAALVREARGPDRPPAHRAVLVAGPDGAAGTVVWVLPGGPGALPGDGEWVLTVASGTPPEPTRVRTAAALLARLPERQADGAARRTLVRAGGGAIGLLVEPPERTPAQPVVRGAAQPHPVVWPGVRRATPNPRG